MRLLFLWGGLLVGLNLFLLSIRQQEVEGSHFVFGRYDPNNIQACYVYIAQVGQPASDCLNPNANGSFSIVTSARGILLPAFGDYPGAGYYDLTVLTWQGNLYYSRQEIPFMSWKFMNAQNRHWHPSGRWLISEPQRNGDDYYSDIYLLHDLKTGEVGSLSLPGEDFPWQWSPDGTWLYAWTQEGRDVSFFRRPLEADVWEERQIKSMTAMPGQPFSYDGSRIIVARTWRGIRDLYAFNFTTEASDYLNNNELYELAAFWAGPEDSLWVYGMNTSGETYLWNEEAPEGLYRVQNRGSLHFSPSPDGSCLLYADHAPGQTQTDIYQVCLGDVSPRLPLGTTPENEAEPVYVPDVTLPWRPERSAIAGALLILLSLLGAYAPNISPAFTRRPGRTAHSNSPASSNTPSRFR